MASSDWSTFVDWQFVLPPNRPGQYFVTALRELLEVNETLRSGPIAILGSTPEFRSLVHGLHCQTVHVFEKHLQFYEATTSFLTARGSELVVEGDWRTTLARHRSSFNLILSDLTMGNIPYAERSQFYADVLGALRPGGAFVDRVLQHRVLLPLGEAIATFQGRVFNLASLNDFNSTVLFNSDIIADGLVDTSAILSQLNAQYGQLSWMRPYLDYLPKISPEGSRWYYGRRWESIARTYCEGGRAVSWLEEPIQSPYHRCARVMRVEIS